MSAERAHTRMERGEQERIVPGTAIWDVHYPEHLQRYEFVAARMPPGARVLDAGTGVGHGAATLVDRGASRVVAVDLAAEAVALAREHFSRPQIEWLVEDCQVLAEAGRRAPFDLVCNLENLEHLPDPERFLRRVRELLAPDGVLITSTPNRIGANRLRGLPAGASSPNPFHFREYTVEEFRTLLAQHFEHIEIHVQTYDPIERMTIEPALVSLWRHPLLRLDRAARAMIGRPGPTLEDQLPPRRWQILDQPPGDELTITQLAVCRLLAC